MRALSSGLKRSFSRLSDGAGDAKPNVTWATTIDDTFMAPYSGDYLVGAYGEGGYGSNNTVPGLAASGGTGGLAVRKVFLTVGQAITARLRQSASVTFPDGSTMIGGAGAAASGATPGLGGDASGGDINLSGVPGSANGAEGKAGTGDLSVPGGRAKDGYAGGPGAPSSWPFVGGRGGNGESVPNDVSITSPGQTPGGGGGAAKGNASNSGGKAQVRIYGY